MSGILDGDVVVITGVATPDSIAFHAAKNVLSEGGEVVYLVHKFVARTAFEAVSTLYADPADIKMLVVDLNVKEEVDDLAAKVLELTDGRLVDAVLHSVAFGKPKALAEILDVPSAAIWQLLQTSVVSLAELVRGVESILRDGGRVVTLSYDSSKAIPGYCWMGVAKAALEASSRQLARVLGPRGIKVNVISSGPIWSKAASGIPTYLLMETASEDPWLAWDVTDVAVTIGVHLSSLCRVTASNVFVDGGVHARGASPHDMAAAEAKFVAKLAADKLAEADDLRAVA